MLRLRRCANLALALVLSIFSVAPHQHDGLAEYLFSDRTTEVGRCDTPHARHFHASRLVHGQQCIACVRQHSTGALRLLVVAVERPIAVGTPSIAIAQAPATSIIFTPLRAPPA